MKKLLLSITVLLCYFSSSAIEKVMSRTKWDCLGNLCSYTNRELTPMFDFTGDGKIDFGVTITCSGPGFSWCPRTMINPDGGNDGDWDENTIYAGSTLVEYAENQIGSGVGSGNHTITVTNSSGNSATFKVVFSGNYSDPNHSWDKIDIYRL